MATVIKLKRGTSAPTTGDIVSGEVAVDTSAQKFYINDGGTVKELGGVNLTNPVVTGSVIFEGATADSFETTLSVVDPTADRTISLPNVSGTLPVLAAASTTQITATPEELNYSDGVTSNIQTQLDTKASNAFAIAQAVALG